MRLGFAVKVLGRAGLKSNDARRRQNSPHLRVSIEYAHAIFDYLAEIEPRIIERKDKTTGKKVKIEAAPLASQHADYVAKRRGGAQSTPSFDVMCEAKAKDLAVLQLRETLKKSAPEFVLE